MKGYTNNPNGRPKKSATEKRKMVSYRLTHSAIAQIKKWAELHECSQSDEVIAMVEYFLKH